MAKIKFDECKHRRVEVFGQAPVPNSYTCLACFRRLAEPENGTWIRQGRAAPPLIDALPWDGLCGHPTAKLISLDTPGSSMHRALCQTCGCVVEHPPGPGEWTPVLFYRLVINEEPEL